MAFVLLYANFEDKNSEKKNNGIILYRLKFILTKKLKYVTKKILKPKAIVFAIRFK